MTARITRQAVFQCDMCLDTIEWDFVAIDRRIDWERCLPVWWSSIEISVPTREVGRSSGRPNTEAVWPAGSPGWDLTFDAMDTGEKTRGFLLCHPCQKRVAEFIGMSAHASASPRAKKARKKK